MLYLGIELMNLLYEEGFTVNTISDDLFYYSRVISTEMLDVIS